MRGKPKFTGTRPGDKPAREMSQQEAVSALWHHKQENERALAEVAEEHPEWFDDPDYYTKPVGIPPFSGGDGASQVDRATAVLEANQPYASWMRAQGLMPQARSAERPSFAGWLKGIVSGDYSGYGSPELRASLGEGSIGTGGALVPAPLSADLIDLARSKVRVLQAGAQVVPMTSATLAIARLASDPGSAWKAESAAVAAPTDPTFERVTFTAHTLIGLVRCSRELLEDAVNADVVLRNAFAQSLAGKLDKAACRRCWMRRGAAGEPPGDASRSATTCS